MHRSNRRNTFLATRQFHLYRFKCMLVTAVLHIFCNQGLNLCLRADGGQIVRSHKSVFIMLSRMISLCNWNRLSRSKDTQLLLQTGSFFDYMCLHCHHGSVNLTSCHIQSDLKVFLLAPWVSREARPLKR